MVVRRNLVLRVVERVHLVKLAKLRVGGEKQRRGEVIGRGIVRERERKMMGEGESMFVPPSPGERRLFTYNRWSNARRACFRVGLAGCSRSIRGSRRF